MKSELRRLAAIVAASAVTLAGCSWLRPYEPPAAPKAPVAADVKLLDQGAQWDAATRAAFYTQDQGSRIMPLAWFKALRQADGTPFAADSLTRYGYLENGDAVAGLPVGFTTGTWNLTEYVGMTCSACHTRQIRAGDATYRVDGGPALTDLHGFFADLDAAMQRTLATDESFAGFAAEVLGKDATADAVARLKTEVVAFAGPYHTLMTRGLPQQGWGVGRADAVGMILNRVSGLDIGVGPDHVIAANINPASAPVRYPFLWNAAIQDKTQWPGFAANGNDILGLVRNLGEVYGVFGVMHPNPRPLFVGGIDYISVNSANFVGLDRLEQMVRRIGKPVWPWKLDAQLVERGRVLFGTKDASGSSCQDCHGVTAQAHFLLPTTWVTPIKDVGTDRREYDILAWTGSSGVLKGAWLPLLPRIKAQDSLVAMLKLSVAGAILQKAGGVRQDVQSDTPSLASMTASNQDVVTLATKQTATVVGQITSWPYESRVLEGIWAAAPYLHNGSVPTLAALLEPADKRPDSFDVGADYDIDTVGLAKTQAGLHSTTQTTGCGAGVNSGNSRCGHEFGVWLSNADKKALLEYLKSL